MALVGLVDAHRGAFEYDWRARFHLPLTVVGKSMSWGEAVRLSRELSRDWSSAVAAALAGWDYPLSREAIVMADLYDLQHITKAKRRPAPYPRPWKPEQVKKFGTSMTKERLRAVLDANREVDDDG